MSKLRPLKLPYGVKDGRLVHVSQVESGVACGCVSPLDDQTPLVARKGERYRAHFAAYTICDPVAARETLYHRLAKQTLSDERRLLLPSIEFRLERRHIEIRPATTLNDLLVEEERQIEGGLFRADSIVTLKQASSRRSLVVEWVVTHPCEPAKIEFFRRRRIPSLEIDIGVTADNLTPDRARDWILFGAPRKWLWHPAFEWNELRRRGLVLVRRPAFSAVRFFKTRGGPKAVQESWVKNCPFHERIVSTRLCRACPFVYQIEPRQEGFVDCMADSSPEFRKLLGPVGEPKAAIAASNLWYEKATPNLGSGFRVGWDRPRPDLDPEVAKQIRNGPFA